MEGGEGRMGWEEGEQEEGESEANLRVSLQDETAPRARIGTDEGRRPSSASIGAVVRWRLNRAASMLGRGSSATCMGACESPRGAGCVEQWHHGLRLGRRRCCGVGMQVAAHAEGTEKSAERRRSGKEEREDGVACSWTSGRSDTLCGGRCGLVAFPTLQGCVGAIGRNNKVRDESEDEYLPLFATAVCAQNVGIKQSPTWQGTRPRWAIAGSDSAVVCPGLVSGVL
ncbi:hypothetical protein B0H14DRAFT_2646185 [Mycena olivaceomarginata]|nr:hypothetical protein B0H14DRAFT_2646185 [Mycena olivaceomarginata]